MGWAIETVFEWFWDEVTLAVHRRYGVVAATAVFLSPFIVLALLIGLVFLLVK
ncbi:hypothetical protein ACG3SL_09040 [Sphingomonas sp. CJ20]